MSLYDAVNKFLNALKIKENNITSDSCIICGKKVSRAKHFPTWNINKQDLSVKVVWLLNDNHLTTGYICTLLNNLFIEIDTYLIGNFHALGKVVSS